MTAQKNANNGSWSVSVPDPRAAHTGGHGLYVEVDKAWRVANLAQLLLPRYVPRAGKETLLHLSFWASAEKLRSSDPTPTITVALVDLHKNSEVLGTEVVRLTHDWQLHYVVVDLKTEHVGHSIRPYMYIGRDAGIYRIDDIEYKEIEIEDGMAWLQRAPERIRRARMARYQLTFLDLDDWPIDYGEASVALKRHAFPFGVSLKTRPGSGMETADYLWYLKTAARHFWAGNLPQQLQWYEYEPQPGEFKESRKAVEDLVEWAESQRWGGFSASLFDGGHAAKEHWSNKLACKDLERHLHQRLMRDMHQFSGKIQHYEVWRGALEWRDWIDRCGEELFLNAFKWAAQADARGVLCSSEGNVLNTLTLTNAEAYHNLVYGMRDKGVPLGAVCVQARFDGEVDASTVKHRLDVLKELELPIFVTDVSVAGLDPAKHAYEIEKFIRVAFSHEAVGGIFLGDLWDRKNPQVASGLYADSKQPKPAAARLEALWGEEWRTSVTQPMGASGVLDFEGFHGLYEYTLSFGDLTCSGEIDLEKMSAEEYEKARRESSNGEVIQPYFVKCDWEGHVHVPVWATPALIALVFVACLLACFRKRRELVHRVGAPSGGKRPLRQTELGWNGRG